MERFAAAAQWKTYAGPWQLREDLEHESAWAKYRQPLEFAEFTATFSGYHATWRPTEQSPERAIGTRVCPDEFCLLDPTATGETLRYIATARLVADSWRATLYGQYYDWDMFSNPTYDFQIHQFDRRWTSGGRFERTLLKSARFNADVGVEVRYDDIGNVGLDHTDARAFVENLGKNSVRESSEALYAEGTWIVTDALRLMAGLRGDFYSIHVDAKSPVSSAGNKSDHQAQWKVPVNSASRQSKVHGSSVRDCAIWVHPLVADNSQRASSDQAPNLRAAYSHGHYSYYGELLNALDHRGKDVVYWYAAHVPGLDPPGFQEEGRISRAEEPRTVRVGLKYEF